MHRTFTGSIVLAACALLGLAAFQNPTPPQDPPKPAPPPAPKPDLPERIAPGAPIRIASFPGADKEKAPKQYELLIKWLSKDLTRPVEIVPQGDSAAALSALLENKVEMAWLDGQAALRAEEASKGKCWPIFSRDEDMKCKSYFIANKKLVDAGTFKALEERTALTLEPLAALKPKFAGVSFSFGAKHSTAAHLMPRYFLERPEVGIDPEKNFKQKPAFAPAGGDASVLSSVASGAVDVGVVDASVWEAAKDEEKARAPVIYVTPEYMDSSMVLYNRVGPTLSLRILGAFVRIESAEPKTAEQKAVLELFNAKRFVQVAPANLAGLREILKSVKERGLFD